MSLRTAAVAALALGLATPALADDWKDESGKGRERAYGYSYRYDDGHDRHRMIPAGHRPPRGMCRVWYPHLSPGQQPAPVSCRRALRIAERTDAIAINSRGRLVGY